MTLPILIGGGLVLVGMIILIARHFSAAKVMDAITVKPNTPKGHDSSGIGQQSESQDSAEIGSVLSLRMPAKPAPPIPDQPVETRKAARVDGQVKSQE